MTEITTEDLLTLTKSADLLRQTAERALKADTYERELRQANSDCEVLRELANRLARENETLARNVPPQSIFDMPVGAAALQRQYEKTQEKQVSEPQSSGFVKVIGQAWCRTIRQDLRYPTLSLYPTKGYMVLCNVHQDIGTGGLTYTPVAINDLPTV